MKIKNLWQTLCGAAAIALMTSCGSAPTLEGAWLEPVPGMENEVQGIHLEAAGRARSINLATLQYESWSQDDNFLILNGQSLGNGQTIEFSDTLEIRELTPETLVLQGRGDALPRRLQRQR